MSVPLHVSSAETEKSCDSSEKSQHHTEKFDTTTTSCSQVEKARGYRSLSSWVEHFLLRKFLTVSGECPIQVVLWDGWELDPTANSSLPTVRILDRHTLWRLLIHPHYQFMEAYAQGRLKVDGDLTSVVGNLLQLVRVTGGPPRRKVFPQIPRMKSDLARVNRRNVHHHYDLSNVFYRLWLDEQLLYTCAYFSAEDLTLESAQIAKMDHICRKLRLRSGEMVIEAGCGWGALALHMARHYGVRVRAYNLSREQLQYARDRAQAEGLTGQVEFIEDDWSNIRGQCDAFVSVGMLEHVGPENFPQLGKILQQILRPQSRALIHTIGQNLPEPLNPWIKHRIFPGAQPPTLSQMMEFLQPSGFTVWDVENLRPHYAKTLKHWLDRFETAAENIRTMFDDVFVRTWRMYLASSKAAFDTGELELYQVLFAPSSFNGWPATRTELYQ